tara:strand:+ start:1192 stop:1389 length:198 start_codon:yes stop_codon:yes gene_type:complete
MKIIRVCLERGSKEIVFEDIEKDFGSCACENCKDFMLENKADEEIHRDLERQFLFGDDYLSNQKD